MLRTLASEPQRRKEHRERLEQLLSGGVFSKELAARERAFELLGSGAA